MQAHGAEIAPFHFQTFFVEALGQFTRTVKELSQGNRQEALAALLAARADEVGTFFIEHGQQSAYFRVNDRKKIDEENKSVKKENETPRLNPSLEKDVFKRDCYRCRYCGQRIVAKEVFSEVSRILGSENFSVERENSKRNGLTLGLRGVADHVDPYASGGETEADNLVTSCYSCNFGKAGYTLKQMGLNDPRARKPVNDDWNGLTEFLPALKRN
jgi:5-methylcytosine-specific restriction endonuclease McrA